MTPVECIARLCALVPPPCYPLTRFHGVLAPRAKLRPRGRAEDSRERAAWATLLARTFDVDGKACARCAGRLEVRAAVTDHDIARKILEAIPTAA